MLSEKFMLKKYTLFMTVLITLKLLFFYAHFHIFNQSQWESSFGLSTPIHFIVEFIIYNILFFTIIYFKRPK